MLDGAEDAETSQPEDVPQVDDVRFEPVDRGDEAVLEPGMVFTVEPGVYLKDVGGFRHSDTVVITKDGNRVMTDYPRELDDLVITP